MSDNRTEAAPNVWFSDVDDTAPKSYQWQPVLMAPNKTVLTSLETWFNTKDQCDDWIHRNLIHTRHEGDSPSATPGETRLSRNQEKRRG